MMEIHSKYDIMHINGIFYALFCINRHVIHVKIACCQYVRQRREGQAEKPREIQEMPEEVLEAA